MTMETPLLRDGTKLPGAAPLLADVYSKNQLILRKCVYVIIEICNRMMETSHNKPTQLRYLELNVAW